MHIAAKVLHHLLKTQHERTQDPAEAALLEELEAEISAEAAATPAPVPAPAE